MNPPPPIRAPISSSTGRVPETKRSSVWVVPSVTPKAWCAPTTSRSTAARTSAGSRAGARSVVSSKYGPFSSPL